MWGVSAPSLIVAWVSLEINLLLFIFLLRESQFSPSKSLTALYFCPQAIASIVFLFSIVVMGTSSSIAKSLIVISIIMKIGMPPFHLWFISLRCLISSKNFYILSTLQKIIPIFILSFIASPLFRAFVVLWVVASLLIVVNQVWFIKILAISSILNSAWAVVAYENISVIVFFIIAYGAGLARILHSLSPSSRKSLKLWTLASGVNIFLFVLGVASVAGIPPFLGFTGKLVVLSALADPKPVTMLIILIFSTAFRFIYVKSGSALLIKYFNSPVLNMAYWNNASLLIIVISLPAFLYLIMLCIGV